MSQLVNPIEINFCNGDKANRLMAENFYLMTQSIEQKSDARSIVGHRPRCLNDESNQVRSSDIHAEGQG